MDSRAAFAFVLIAIGLAGLWALATGRLSIKNGQIVIGPAASTSSTTSGKDTTSGTGGKVGGSTGGTSAGGKVPTPGPMTLADILGGVTSGTQVSQIYNPSGLELVSSIAGDGAAVNPYGVGAVIG